MKLPYITPELGIKVLKNGWRHFTGGLLVRDSDGVTIVEFTEDAQPWHEPWDPKFATLSPEAIRIAKGAPLARSGTP